ncbi:MAG: ATP-binding protein [Candidatus Flexifilum sp.]|jgi:ATP-dependent DNA helicase RecG
MLATAEDLLSVLKTGRSERLDWFPEQTAIEAIAATLTAMANSQGGTVVIGAVGQGPTITGVRDADQTVDRIIQAALAVEPQLFIPMPRQYKLGDKLVIAAVVPQGMPHVYALDGRYLIRQDCDNVALKPRDLRRLVFERGESNFETDVPRGSSIDDIDWEKARAYVAGLGTSSDTSVEAVLQRRGCLIEHEGRLRPTNAGILLFGKEPQRFVHGAEITAVRFPGETMGDKFTREDITGTLPDQLRRAEAFLLDHLRKGVSLGKTMARSENYEYPMEAARELVVNAVAHRNYSLTGDTIRLFIFKDRMEVTSPGGLPGPVTVSNIKDERFSRNPIIVQVLSDLGFIERLGYGVDRVIDLMRERKLREPQFTETAGGFRVSLFNEVVESEHAAKNTALTTALHGSYRGMPINIRQEAAITFLLNTNGRITNSDLQSLCRDVHPETIRRDLADLVNKKILRKLGEKRGSYYVLSAPDENTV